MIVVENKRINWIDWAKVLTMFMVVLAHLNFNASNQWLKIFIFSFHMPFFFMLSGYLSKPEDSFKSLIVRNTKTLLLPFLYLSIICLIVFNIPMSGWNIWRVKWLLGHMARADGWGPAGAAWFLVCLSSCKILVHFTLKTKLPVQAILHAAFVILAIYIVSYHNPDLLWKLPSALVGSLFFILGYHLRQTKWLEMLTSKRLIAILLLPTFVLQAYLSQIQGLVGVYFVELGNYPPLYFVAAINGSFMMILFCMLLNKVSLPLLRTISAGNIIILATHLYVTTLFLMAFAYIPIFSDELTGNIIASALTMLVHYYPIILIQKYCPFIMGNRK